MELNTISGLAIAGVICSVVLSMGVPIALFIAGRVKLKARISSFFIGAGTYLLFAMLLEQLLHVLVIQFCGLNAQSRPWLYYVYAAFEYSCAVTPQVRQTGNRLSGLAGTAYASLFT